MRAAGTQPGNVTGFRKTIGEYRAEESELPDAVTLADLSVCSRLLIFVDPVVGKSADARIACCQLVVQFAEHWGCDALFIDETVDLLPRLKG